MDPKNVQTATKNTQKGQNQPMTEAELAKSLGNIVNEAAKTEAAKVEAKVEAVVQATTPVTTPPAKSEAEIQLEKLLSAIPAGMAEKFRKLPGTAEDKLDMAKDLFKVAHPEGLITEFNEKVLEAVKKLSDEYGVPVTGKFVKVSFPNGEGTVPTVEVVDPTAVSGKKAKTEGAVRAQWGESSATTKDGKTMAFETPGAMGRHFGLLMKGWQFKDNTECFTKPHDADTGKELPPRWKIVSAEKGKGIHIQEI